MKHFIKSERTLSLFNEGPLGRHLNSYAQCLRDRGYARRTACEHLRVAAGFSRWLKKRNVALEELTSEHASRYLGTKVRNSNSKSGHAAALNSLLQLLRQKGIVKEEEALLPTAIERLIEEFAHYLRTERGLAVKSVIHYKDFTNRFLKARFGDAELNVSSVCAADVVGFVQRQAPCLGNAEAKLMTGALRSFLRYARFQGYINNDLASAVPAVAKRSPAKIPRALPSDEVNVVLNRCDRSTAIGRRDYAVLLLLSRLGVRACEIVSLKLDDIDWKAGYFMVRGKGHQSKLPLPPDVGKAIADYLCNGRPLARSRAVFLRHQAPIGGFKGSQSVDAIVRIALSRAEVDSPGKGAHQFRHGLATEMLRRGASLSEIGELLGHRRPQSTALYAKVDLSSLRMLALPWPGGEK